MKKEDIHLFDIQRILQGNVPTSFYIELIIRGFFVYFLITFGMKYMGKRVSAELTRSELAATSSLAAATGLIIMAPERGMLPPLVVLIVMLMIKNTMDRRNFKSVKFEQLVVGRFSILIEEGVLRTHEMIETRMSQEQLFSQLRKFGIIHLGMVKRLYIEANGSFSLVKDKEKKSGLPVIPSWDKDFLNGLKRLENVKVCSHCGEIKQQEAEPCSNCKSVEWQHPVES